MQTKSKIPIAVGMVLVSLAGSAYYFNEFRETDVAQMESQNLALQAEIDKKTDELKRLRDFQLNIERVKQELRELNLQLESALEHMPRTFNLSGLLKHFTQLSQNSGVELASFKPKKGVDTQGHGAFYSTISIEFEIRGTFVHTLQFLDQIARLKRIINIESLKLRSADRDIAKIGGAVGVTQGVIRTYRFSE
ncbi:MAG: type 4a pilus biogenesis protein PilO [Deltaproteobacteria bacterium]|nr:type 4a pilus biogenesis protein PilO [Deltaproteobacteria bacterium]MBI3293945.1 type 4a pilus biogenesis protein PilO [Deltaproteobacteria bacterium]